jgi:hypothetical protein
VRMGLRGQGKSGGSRVIYYARISRDVIFLKTQERPNRFEGLLDKMKDWKAGKTRWKTTLLEKDGTRTVFEESFPKSRSREASSAP